MENTKVVMYDSPEAATYTKNIEGWVSSTGRFFGKGKDAEHMARYEGSSHYTCECGGIAKKGYTKCDKCSHQSSIERYEKLPYKDYMGEPVFSWDHDEYFYSEEDIIEYLEENELESIDLLFCEEQTFYPVQSDYWDDILPTDSEGDIPDELKDALKVLNNVILKLPPASYVPGKIRTNYALNI